MRLIMYTFLGVVLALLAITPIACAQELNQRVPGVFLAGMGGGGMGGSGMGGGMGGSGMMGGRQGIWDLWNGLSRMWGAENPKSLDHRSSSTERLRSGIKDRFITMTTGCIVP